MKTNLLKSIFISLILVMGICNVHAETVTFTSDDILFFNKAAVSWWGNDGVGMFVYFFNNSTNKDAWSTNAQQYSGDVYYVKIPAGTWEGVILTRNSVTSNPTWNNKYNQTGNISLSSTKNYISTFSENSGNVTWDTQKPTSSGSLAASSTSVNTGTNVTLTPSLISNTTYNEIKSTSYSIAPSSGASINDNTFTATAEGTYTITATITYNPRGYASLTSTTTATTTITVKSLKPTTIYLKPGDWKNDNARLMVFAWKTAANVDGEWFEMSEIGCDREYFKYELPAGYTAFSLCRLNPNLSIGWDAKWNQSEDYTIDDEIYYLQHDAWGQNGGKCTFTKTNSAPEITYTITLNRQGGTTGDQSVTATYGSPAPSFTKPTWDNYTFEGYYTQENGQGDLYIDKNGAWQDIDYIVDGKWMKPACNLILYAKWEQDAYTVTIQKTEHGTVTPSGEQTIPANGIEVTAEAEEGYTFIGWTTTGNVTVDDPSSPTTTIRATASGGTVTANFGLTIYLETNGNWRKDNADFAVYAYNDAISANEWLDMSQIDCSQYYTCTIPDKYTDVIFCRMDPNRNGNDWHNGGMWTQSIDKHISDVENVCFQITDDHWDENNAKTEGRWIAYPGTYTITLNQTNGGTITTSPASPVAPNTEVTVTMNPKDGYSFESGKITIGTGAEQDINAESTHTICGNTTISAKWSAHTYTVIFNANGGDCEMADQFFTYDVEQPLTTNTFTRTGYTFAGWATTSDGESTYADGANVKNLTTENGGKVTLYAKWTENTYTVTISADENGSVSPSGDRQIGISGIVVTATPTDPGKFKFAKWEVTGGAQVESSYSYKTRVTATTDGSVIAHFEELQPKTIYLKTVEGTTDGYKWYIVYDGQKHLMDELGCTGEFYRGSIIEGTPFHFVSKDDKGTEVQRKGTDLQYVEGKTLYNLVSASASGDKIFFNPNTNWLSKNWNNDNNYEGQTPRFAALFDGNTWLDMTDNNDDKIFECVKPSGATKVYFCRMKPNTTANSWNEKWQQTDEQTIPNGKNLFTLPANVSLSDWARGGTWSTHADTPVNGDGEWEEFTGVTYRITFDQQEATTAGTTHVDVAYRSSMPEIEKLPTKTEKKFGGYYTEANGQGVMLVNAFGEWQDAMGYIASGTWESETCVTLYAHWTDLTPEITDVTLNAEIFEPVDDNEEGIVTAVPTINEHNNTTLEYIVCWKLLYSNGREVEGTQEDPDKYKATVVEEEGDKVQFSIAGLPTGTYIIRASLRTGDDCNSGEEISRYDKKFAIVANRVITVHYTCDGKEIKASTKEYAHVIEPTSITAPDIVGYTFKEWVAGDGVIISTANKASKTIEFTAYYDGSLTATYTKKKMVYFYNTMGWEDVYVYFYSSDKYWDDYMGSGSQKDKEIGGTKAHWYEYRGKMTQIQGTKIWYFDFLSLGGEIEGYTNIVFNRYQQDNYEWFSHTEVVRRADFNADKLPMYVPIKAAEETKNGTKYYNKGYWMNYPENTGYKLQIYDGMGDGAKEVASIRFPYSSNTIMPLTVSVDLEAGKTYGFKILREDNTYFSNSGTMTANSNGWSFTYGIDQNCGLQTTLAGDYTFTLKYAAPDNNNPNDYQYCVDVVYPVSVGDYRVVYQDNAEWSLGKAHDANWYHPSYAIKKNNSTTEEKTDIVSFFIAKNHNPSMKFQKCTAINGQTVTWADVANGTISTPKDKTEASVYNFIIKQPAGGKSISVESVEPYTGNYYIRVDAMDGKWGNYKTDPDNRMTYSAFSESDANKFGDKFSHYATKWCEEGTNVKFTIANDYSPCISDTLIQDNGNPFKNIDTHGNLTSNSGKHAANIRFMWNRHTNKISRAYVAGSTFTDRQFLILKADKEIKNSAGGNLTNEGDNHNAHQAIFEDTQNWIYERTLQVKPATRVKLYACYPIVDVANAQYFCGTYDNNNPTWNDENSIQILGGQGGSWNTIRVIYDFKTNRLMAAWIPTGEINEVKSLEADMMILREHQEDAACITFANSAEDKLINVQTVYGVLRFNKYILNNKKTTGGHEILDPKDQKTIYERALYFISFPFDVHLSDVFGFGTYGTHWVISEYNGLRRAKYGFFENNCFSEDCTNWDYIWDPSNVTLKANQGYLLSLDLDLMKDNNTSFWAHGINTVELYFPSFAEVNTIQQTNYTTPALGEDYRCKIRGQEQVDSYWRCIGVPSFADYNSTLSDGENQIKWQPKGTDFPFLYEWNVSDNSLIVQSTTTYRFRPTYAYLVQNGREIHWTAVNSKPSTSIIARQRTEAERNYEWKIALMRNSNQEDQTFLRISDNEDVTTEFDFNQDLAKELNYGRSDIYTLINSVRVAANSMPCSDKTTIIPLGLNIEQAGDYTIAMPEGVENIGITLVDNETGIHTNLSAGQEYTLTLNNGICENRLFIEVSPIQNTPTDLEYTTEDTREQTTRKVLINEKLYIIRDGVVYDAQGHRL